MGAEMLVQSIGFIAKDGHQIDEEWATLAFAKARRTIDAIDQVRMTDINDPQGSAYADVQTCKRQLLSDVAEVEAALLGHRRQAAMVDGGDGIILLLSGGMSWAIRRRSCSTP